MANNEAQFRTELIKEFRVQGAYAKYISHKMFAGIPDIYVKHPHYPCMWMELKFATSLGQKLKLTPVQRAEILSLQTAGDIAGWVICIRPKPGEWVMYASRNHKAIYATEGELVCQRKIGTRWGVEKLITTLYAPKPMKRD